jgi:Tol biopolymer transport system component
MSWDEDEFRRALGAAAEDGRPSPDALGLLRARAARRQRRRVATLVAAGAAAVVAFVVLSVALRPAPARDVEFSTAPASVSSPDTAPAAVSEEADGGSIYGRISGNGRFVVFMSEATNLVDDDTNFAADTFVRDLSTGTVERVSLSSAGEQGNGPSLSASISDDGRYVAFRSFASNLVPGDTNDASDIFVRDRVARTTTRISVSSGGRQANGGSDSASISADGRVVAFRSLASNLDPNDDNGLPDIFVRDLAASRTELVSRSTEGARANGDSKYPQLSADGSRVAFASLADNLVRADTNRTWDVFMRDVPSGTTILASVSDSGRQGNHASFIPAISADGNQVAFVSASSTLVPGDTNGVRDVFVRDLATESLSRVSVTSSGDQANGASFSASLSADGRFIAMSSNASNLGPRDSNGHRDVFVLDRATGAVTLASVGSDGATGNADSGGPSISADGRFVVFQSYASTLSAGDRNDVRDIFLHDRLNGTTSRVST